MTLLEFYTTATVTKRFRSWSSDGKFMLTVFGDSWGLICEHCPWTDVDVGPQWASHSREGQCQGSLNAR